MVASSASHGHYLKAVEFELRSKGCKVIFLVGRPQHLDLRSMGSHDLTGFQLVLAFLIKVPYDIHGRGSTPPAS